MSLSTFMSPKQPGVPSRVCHLVGAISGGRFYVPLFRARATHHITSHQNIRPRGVRSQEERKRRITRSCEYKCKPQFGQILTINFICAWICARILSLIKSNKCQVPVQLGLIPGNAWQHQTEQSSKKRRITRKAEETRQRVKASRDVWPAGGPSLETQLCNFYIKGHCDCLKVSLNIVKDLCNIDLTPIFNFK